MTEQPRASSVCTARAGCQNLSESVGDEGKSFPRGIKPLRECQSCSHNPIRARQIPAHNRIAEEPHLGSNRLHQPIHVLFLQLNRFHQLELCTATIEIVSLAMNLEVGVARYVVRQEANTDLECN